MHARQVLAVLAIASFATEASATYSIVATDAATGQVGGAGTSCVGSMDVFVIYGSAAGHGAVHAQAYSSAEGRDEAVRLLALDTPPADIIDAITAPSFDGMASRRQYGIADVSGRAAGFTGSDNGDFAGDVQGTTGTFTYSVQGNILTSDLVIENASTAFASAGCDLADRLMLALEAGASGGEGDSRCTPAGIPSDSGFIHVDLADGSEFLHLSVTATAPGSPVVHLRSLYDAWRAEHPCPGLPDEAPDASADASEDPGLDLLEDTPPDLPEDPAPDDEVDPEMVGIVPGCGCSTAPGSPASAAPLLLAAGLLLACRRKV